MNKCIKCGSYAFNLYKEDIDQGGLCDVHYWQGRAHMAEALAQPEQEPVAHRDGFWCKDLTCKKCYSADFRFKHTTPPQPQSEARGLSQSKPLTDEEWQTIADTLSCFITRGQKDVIEAKPKERNT